jgi:hypothetical protein
MTPYELVILVQKTIVRPTCDCGWRQIFWPVYNLKDCLEPVQNNEDLKSASVSEKLLNNFRTAAPQAAIPSSLEHQNFPFHSLS